MPNSYVNPMNPPTLIYTPVGPTVNVKRSDGGGLVLDGYQANPASNGFIAIEPKYLIQALAAGFSVYAADGTTHIP